MWEKTEIRLKEDQMGQGKGGTVLKNKTIGKEAFEFKQMYRFEPATVYLEVHTGKQEGFRYYRPVGRVLRWKRALLGQD